MNKKELTPESVVASLEKVLEESGPDYVYELAMTKRGLKDCLYFTPDGFPSSLVGRVFADHGYGPRDVEEGVWVFGQVFVPTGAVGVILTEAQSKQDSGTPYGEIIPGAVKYLKNYIPDKKKEN